MEELAAEQIARASRLIGVGAQSGAVVVGLSGVRRTRGLALVFLDASVSANTQREMTRLERQGARIFLCAQLADLTRPMGREDVSVVGVRSGSLARGMAKLLPQRPKESSQS
ncbi:MAG TPA: hypothetical protein DIC52_03835 [Candidatus Latescibacteria bacterium]|jgi:hypothetical protein|nr:hypothetical protein [Candidatus Latescibacterota bacterium]|tara:strand:+ start:493 stop:828 length:336 start_codon:yes stop_codon:yes gene_type:complete